MEALSHGKSLFMKTDAFTRSHYWFQRNEKWGRETLLLLRFEVCLKSFFHETVVQLCVFDKMGDTD